MKTLLIEKILNHLNHELSTLFEAANNAHLAATDDQSIAETQYDTLAIEAGYLAEGQSRRVNELKLAITAFKTLSPNIQLKNDVVTMGSLVQLSKDELSHHFFFIAPAAAGFRCTIDGQNITVITEASPMGKALKNKIVGDEISVNLGKTLLIDEVINIK